MIRLSTWMSLPGIGRTAREPIIYWDRAAGVKKTEKVYGDAFVRILYSSNLGKKLADSVFANRWMSKAAGVYQSSDFSRSKIQEFVRAFDIPMEEYEEGPFRSFNDFFIRKFKPGVREFTQNPNELAAFAEARYLAFKKVDPEQIFPVKGQDLSALTILGDIGLSRQFLGGPVLIARLCPTDYHRFHFPDQGKVLKTLRIEGKLHSVNPLALQMKSDIFSANERQVSILETQNFGKLAYVEVGAMCVGKIIQTHSWGKPYERGDEKGYFLFGASTVIVFGEPGAWVPDADLLSMTEQKIETFVQLGDRVASKI